MVPQIRIASFILLTIGLTTTHHTHIWAILPMLYLLYRYTTLTAIWPLLKRLRWLFLSLFILHLGFSPGEATDPHSNVLFFALERTLALIIIVLLAHILVITTPIHDMIAALQWWLAPLQWLGLSSDRLLVRIALILDTVNQVHDLYDEQPLTVTVPHNVIDRYLLTPIQRLSDRVAHLFVQVLARAESVPLQTLEIPSSQSPPWWQWGYLVLISCVMMGGLCVWH